MNEDRGYDIADVLGYSSSFSDVIDSSLKVPTKGLAFISLDGKSISYLSLFKKSGRVATKKDRITFSKLVAIEPSILIESLISESPSKLKKHLANQTEVGILKLSPKVFEFALDFVRRNCVNCLSDIEKLINEISGVKNRYNGSGAEIIAYEKDAVSIVLRISGFSDRDLPNWLADDKPAPFLRGFDSTVIREDVMAAHDAAVFGDWDNIKNYVVGAAEFTKEGHKLTIMNVNRLSVEETLGVDLILYHHTYNSYVMIQYKRMLREGSDYVYRPNDKSYASEIGRMKKFLERIAEKHVGFLSPEEYRLNSEFFYFKLCPAELKDPLSTEMIRGMYLPLSYWESLYDSSNTTGPKGGKCFTYENVSRHLNNSQFVDLAQHGWIGSRVQDSNIISEVIKNSIENGKSLILADYQDTKKST